MTVGETTHALRRGDETEKANARRAGALERRHRGDGTAARREHRIEKEKVPLGGVAGNLEVVVDRLERVVIAIETDVTDARPWDEPINAFDHTEPGAKNGHERELLAADALSERRLERRVDRRRL